MKGPTETQARLLRFMADFLGREGMPPTIREMRDFLGCASPTAPLDMCKRLEKKGYVTRRPRRPRVSRGTTLSEKGWAFLHSELVAGSSS